MTISVGRDEGESDETQSKTLTTSAVTKHGATIGYYIPTHTVIKDADKRSLAEASRLLNKLLEEQGLNPEKLIKETQALRSQERA